MSKRGAAPAHITPSAAGWRLLAGAEPPREAATLDELVPYLPAGHPVHLALPGTAVLLDRLVLPASDREELVGMIQLHLEKTLPYPVEEVTSGFEQVRHGENESTVLVIAAHAVVLEKLCEPLRASGRLPVVVSLGARDLAPHLAGRGRVAALWAEQGHLAIAIFEDGKLSWVSSLPSTMAATIAEDLPPLLLTAEVDGVQTAVDQVALASDLLELRPVVAGIFAVTVGLFPTVEITPRTDLNLRPPGWGEAAERVAKSERLQQRLMLAAVIYLLTVAAAFLYLAWTKRQVQVLDAQLAQIQPSVAATQQRQARWLTLTPALDPQRFVVETLFLVNRNRPKDVHITSYESTPAQFMVEGEAPNAGLAIDFAEKLRADKELSSFAIEAGPPRILPNQRAQFRIFGKL